MNKSFAKQLIIILITAILSATFTLGYVYKENFQAMYLKKVIEERYYGEIRDDRIQDGAMAGMVASLGDEHSYFVDGAIGYDAYTQELDGEFSGVGMQIAQTEEGCIITEVFKGSPAEEKGVATGDVIVAVDGEDASAMDPTQISNKVRGKVGTSVSVTFRRGDEEKTFELVRAKVIVPTVESKSFDNVGYIKVTSFNSNTDEDFLLELKKCDEYEGLIIDLRNNGGGLFDSTVNMLNMFINEGDLVTIKTNHEEETFKADGTQSYKKPVVVLVNGLSASSSEFFSVAIKENDRGKIVGTRTYGKGSIQGSFELPNNRGLHLTIGRFYSPKGNEIDKVGVTPDYEVANPEKYDYYDVDIIPFEEDLQLKKAIEVIKNKK